MTTYCFNDLSGLFACTWIARNLCFVIAAHVTVVINCYFIFRRWRDGWLVTRGYFISTFIILGYLWQLYSG